MEKPFITIYVSGPKASGKTRQLNEIKQLLSDFYRFESGGEHTIVGVRKDVVYADDVNTKKA